MNSERGVRLLGGLIIMILVALALWQSSIWLWVLGFVGFMFFQSGLTNFCPSKIILEMFGMKKS